MSFLNKIKVKAKELELENLSSEEASKKLEEVAKKSKEVKKLSREQAEKKELDDILNIFYNGLILDPEYPLGIILLKKNLFREESEKYIIHAETLTQLEKKINILINKNAGKKIFIHYVNIHDFLQCIIDFEFLWDYNYTKIKDGKFLYSYKESDEYDFFEIKSGVIDKISFSNWFQHFYKEASETYSKFSDSNLLKLNELFSNQLRKLKFTRIIELF